MPKLYRLLDKRGEIITVCLAVLVVFTDQLTKWWISSHLAYGETLWDGGFLQIVRIHNTGAAFGIFPGHNYFLLAVDIIGIVVMLAIIFLLKRWWPVLGNPAIRIGGGFILGGTIGNLIDRLRYGGVTDFIDFKVWPVFNVADAAVTTGAVILGIFLIVSAGKTAKNT